MLVEEGPNVVLDGGLATALQAVGLPPWTPVEDWVLERPEDVERAHAAFVAAGARIILTATFRALPHLRADWAEVADRAVAIARKASGTAEVWASIGPASTAERSWADAPFADRATMTSGWAQLAERVAALGVAGIVLETFTDPIECAAAVAQVRSVVPRLPVVASLSPRDDGKLVDGSDPAPVLLRLRQVGASYVGFNCGTGPASILAALAKAPEAEWAKPSSGDLPPSEVAAGLLRLADSCRFVGGCCGVGPAEISALAHKKVEGIPVPSPPIA